MKGFNDFETWCKKNQKEYLLDEWDYEENIIKPDEVTKSSNKTIYWKCNNMHSYEAKLNDRTKENGSNCPYCSNQKVLKGFNDLETWCKENQKEYLLDEWDYEKNTIKPTEITRCSEKKIYWKCNLGHSFKTRLANRTSHNTKCPDCSKGLRTSYPEYTILYYLNKSKVDAIHGYKPNWIGKSEIDVFIPYLNIGIEYDGAIYHQNIGKDIKKNELCKKNGVVLYRIREFKCPLLKDNNSINLIRKDNSDKSLQDIIIELFKNIIPNKEIIIDIEKDNINILNFMELNKVKNSIVETHPEILIEWDYKKNKNLSPSSFSQGSGKKIFWKCSLGHSYKQAICKKINNHNCPYCSNHRVLKGFNDFETWCKENQKEYLLDEWDYEKNTIKPTEITYGSSKTIYWKCNNMHSYEAKLNDRTKENGSNCPYCSNQKLLKGFNDMVTLYPKILEYWDYDRNKDYIPSNWNIEKQGEFKPENIIGKGSEYKVYLKGYENLKFLGSFIDRNYGENNKLEEDWMTKYNLAKQFFKENGHLKITTKYEVNGIKLGLWISNQKQKYKNTLLSKENRNKDRGILTQEQINLLESIGIIWSKK